MAKLRMTMPKKEEDLEKVVEEVYREHPEMLEEEHHHDDEILMVLQTLVESINHLTLHIANLDKRTAKLEEKIEKLIEKHEKIYEKLGIKE
jgi:predicted nuclease with TOPRIM domain